MGPAGTPPPGGNPSPTPGAVLRRVLGGPRPGGRAGSARLRHHRGFPGHPVVTTRAARRRDRPGAGTPRCGPRRGPGRPHDLGHRDHPGRHDDAHRTVPRLEVHRHARLREPRSGRSAGSGVGHRPRGPPVRPAHHRRFRTRPWTVATRDWRPVADLFDEAADFVEVTRRLWDSWEDDAEIRDVATGRFIDREKLHYIDFEGRWFSVKGPSITPRPPQGQPLVTVLAHVPVAFRLAARSADVVFITPTDAGSHGARHHDPRPRGRGRPGRSAAADLRRPGGVPRRGCRTTAHDRKDRLDERARPTTPLGCLGLRRHARGAGGPDD